MIRILFVILAIFEFAVAGYTYLHRHKNFLIITTISESMTKMLTLFASVFGLAGLSSLLAAITPTNRWMLASLVLAALVSGLFSLQIVRWLKKQND